MEANSRRADRRRRGRVGREGASASKLVSESGWVKREGGLTQAEREVLEMDTESSVRLRQRGRLDVA